MKYINELDISMISNGTSTSSGKQQAITAGASVKSSQQLVNGNSSAMELYSGKNSGTPTGPLLPGACDLCDGKIK